MKKIWLVLVVLSAFAADLKADPNSQARIARLQVATQECYPDSRYVVVNQELVPKPPIVPPATVAVYVPAYPVYVAPQPQISLGFGYTYWGGHYVGHHSGGHHGGSGHHGGH